MGFRSFVLTVAIYCAFAPLALGANSRTVQIRWDFTKDSPTELEIWENCSPTDPISTCTGSKTPAPQSYIYELLPNDRVVLVLTHASADGEGEIEAAVTGTNLDDKDLEALKKVINAGAPAAESKKAEPSKANPVTKVKALTDDLIAGGRLTVTFIVKKKDGDKEEIVIRNSGAIVFKTAPANPLFTVSNGIALSQAPNTTLLLSKTSTILTFEKDDKTQQAYEQVIALKDSDKTLKPIQAAMTYVNLRLYRRFYASIGVQLNQKLFEQPLTGFTYRHPIGKRMGFNTTVGIHFSRETEIVPESGFTIGQKVDPTVGLTVGDIPIRERYHRRLGVGFSIDF
jgi:hypothetical protein